MRTSWVALHTSLARVLNRRSSEAAFQMMGERDPVLGQFDSIASLMEHQHALGGDPAVRFSVIRALVTASQSDEGYRSTAHVMVVLALWPGLDAVLWRLTRGFPGARDDLPSDILARVSEVILAVDLNRVSSVVSTILRNVERDIRRDLISQRVRGQASQSIDDPAVGHLAEAMITVDKVDNHVLADHLNGLKPEDAYLLRRVFILGETQEEAGQSLGLNPCAARKRFQRAVAKLHAREKATRPVPFQRAGWPLICRNPARRHEMDSNLDDYEKLPGYYRPWDLAQVILAGRRYRIEDVGVLSDGGALFAIYVSIVPGMI